MDLNVKMFKLSDRIFKKLRKRVESYIFRPRAVALFDPKGNFDVGCGDVPKDGYQGCDVRKLNGVKIISRAWQLSQFTNQCNAIYSRHTLEHLTLDELFATLDDWHLALRLGGTIEVIVPNLDYHIEQWKSAEWSRAELHKTKSNARYALAGFYGWQRECNPMKKEYNTSYWDVHKMGFNQRSLRFFLENAGFEKVETSVKENVHLIAKAQKTLQKRERQVAPTVDGIRADHTQRYKFAIAAKEATQKALDVACGIGYGAQMLADSDSLIDVKAFDIDDASIAYAKKYYQAPNLFFFQSAIEDLNFPEETFDMITAFEIIEHIDSPLNFLQRLNRLLDKNGILILSTPNESVEPFDAKKFPFHKRHFRLSDLKEIAHTSGFDIIGIHCQKDRNTGHIQRGSDGIFLILTLSKRVGPAPVDRD